VFLRNPDFYQTPFVFPPVSLVLKEFIYQNTFALSNTYFFHLNYKNKHYVNCLPEFLMYISITAQNFWSQTKKIGILVCGENVLLPLVVLIQ
jgi:hypothetical protein